MTSREGTKKISRKGAKPEKRFGIIYAAICICGVAIPRGSELSAQALSRSDYPGYASANHLANPEWVVAVARVALETINVDYCETTRFQPLQGRRFRHIDSSQGSSQARNPGLNDAIPAGLEAPLTDERR